MGINALQKNLKAFTLVELTVSMGVLALIVGLTAGVLISVVRSYQKQRAISEIERNGDFIIRTIEENLRSANSISCIEFDQTEVPPTGNITTCNLGAASPGRILVINSYTPRYLGRGSGTSGACAAGANCYAFMLDSIDTQIDTTGNNLQDETKLTNVSTTNGVNVSKFDVLISGGGATGAPYNITVTIDINGPVNSLWATEKRSFQSFLTLRGSYQ